MVSKIEKWVTTSCGIQQARQIPHVTVDFGNLHMGKPPETVNWVLLKLLQQMFSKAIIDIALRFDFLLPDKEPICHNMTLWPVYQARTPGPSVQMASLMATMAQAAPQQMQEYVLSLRGFAALLVEFAAAISSL